VSGAAQLDNVSVDSSRKTSLSAILDNPRLPSLPAVALQIVQHASQPGCEMDELVELLRLDSGMCARVLKTVNSGLFGMSRPVSSLKHAVMLLGIKPLRSLVLSVALPAMQTSSTDPLFLKYWRESVSGAVIARQLAVHLRRPEPEDELVAGLLRDLGMLVLHQAFPQDYGDLWRSAPVPWEGQCEHERSVFGVEHAEVGACVMESWNLPPEIYLPVRHHHDPASLVDAGKPTQDRAWLLYFATRVAMLDTRASHADALLNVAQRKFGMDRANLTKFLDSVTPFIQEFAAILNVDIGKCPDYATILGAGCEELVRLSLETAKSQVEQERARASASGPARAPQKTSSTVMPVSSPAGSPRSTAKSDTFVDFDYSCLDPAFKGSFQLNGYEVREAIGRGAMGVVFKGYDPILARFAAIKMLMPARVVLADARERFMREARASAAIQHENVVSIYAVNDIHGLPYIVMEYVPGTSLEDLLEKQGPLPIADVVRFGRQIAAGLHAAHQRQVIHRDIKPANTLVVPETGAIKITDFGLAKVAHETRLSHDGMWVGTPLYMSPEQFHNAAVDHRSDLFSLGSLLFTLCAGVPPFNGETVPLLMNQICNGGVPNLRTHRATVPIWLEKLIARLHAKSPASRYQSAAEVVAALDKQC
jgi:eukaryotic-like serine/threonine-protein kinase